MEMRVGTGNSHGLDALISDLSLVRIQAIPLCNTLSLVTVVDCINYYKKDNVLMKQKVPDSDIILYATTCKSMREGAMNCGLEASSFYRRAKKLGVYDGNRWRNECIAKAAKKADELNQPLICPYCGKECKNKLSYAGHTRSCPNNR